MRIAVPTMGTRGLDELVGDHFGKVPTYTIVDTERDTVEVIENTSEHMGGTGLPPELMKRHNVHVMLVSGLGIRAIRLFEQLGIMVYTGAGGTVRETLEKFRKGFLPPATDLNACREHSAHVHPD